jgi:hypothetical protein
LKNITRLFVGYSFDRVGPHFIFDDLTTNERQKYYFSSKILSLEKMQNRFCVGTYDLTTFATRPCEKKMAVDTESKDIHCKECQYKIGFNPAFYNSKSISPQQEKYNLTPHVVYLAYFSPTHIKVGIASEKRHSIRLLEQGARAAAILARFENAQMARNLESELCAKEGILERLTSDTKLKLLCSEKYDFNRAKEILLNVVKSSYKKEANSEVIDLTPFYFYGNKIFKNELYRVENGSEKYIAGKLIGMIGDIVILSQPTPRNQIYFAISVKKYISYVVNIYLDEILAAYPYEVKQLTLW